MLRNNGVPTNPITLPPICRDEIPNSKTLDSNFFARFCFENGIDL